MCGIAGLMLIEAGARVADPAATALAMADTLSHRGPDGRDSWGDAEAGVGLGHRRLSIIDLTPTGAQPMRSADGRYVISYNGEVYNFPDLRRELEDIGHSFRGGSDTEVMLASIVAWGLEAAVGRFAGMFAFALFDRQTRTLSLVRDRIGVKPLYWCVSKGVLLFGSELRALMAHPAFSRTIDRDAIAALVRYSYIPSPSTVFQGVYKLPPGSILTARFGESPRIAPYWRLVDRITSEPAPIDFDTAVEQLHELLRTSVRQRMVADVPIGAFLSGGIDSSTIVALMQSVSEQPVRTFTIGFDDAAYDEAVHARAVARHLGTAHTEVVLAPNVALDLVPEVAGWFDEPFADSSQLPSYLVARMTREHVTVALSGDGGDELFAGYPKYAHLSKLWGRVGGLPRPVRAAIGGVLGAMPEAIMARGAALLTGPDERIGEKARRLADALRQPTSDDAARAVAAVGLRDEVVPGAGVTLIPGMQSRASCDDLVSRMQIQDMLDYLPDDILTKVDRCTMAVSLEAREPLIDHRLIEFVWSLPEPVRHGNGRTKGLLRAVLDRYVPPALTDRPKRGFSVPLARWLRGPLRDWAESLLAPDKLAEDGLFAAPRVRAIWERHLSGAETNATGLWNVLMVQAWRQRWQPRA
jgi:asparagine synthase (glutamine-hydrolysing)